MVLVRVATRFEAREAGLGVVGGLLFLGFNILIVLAIWWCVDQEQGHPGGVPAALFEMRSVNRRGKPRRLPHSRGG